MRASGGQPELAERFLGSTRFASSRASHKALKLLRREVHLSMSRIRVFRNVAVYPSWVRSFYAAHPGLSSESFAAQSAAHYEGGLGGVGPWKSVLESSGRYEVFEVVANAAAAQKQWAAEHCLADYREDWRRGILAAQLAHFKPQIWYCHELLPAQDRMELRRQCRSIRLVLGFEGAMLNDAHRLAGCDLVLSSVRESAAYYARAGMRGYWMPWTIDSRLADKLEYGRQLYPVSFCGSLFLGNHVAHSDRLRLLDRVAREVRMTLFCDNLEAYQFERLILGCLARGEVGRCCRGLHLYPAVRRMRRLNRGGRFGVEMLQTLADSKITLNVHGDGVPTAVNMRLFEATGAGTCLVTDWKEDLADVFEPEREVVSFSSVQECVEKLRYLLSHDKERQLIAVRGQRRCLEEHSMQSRIATFRAEVLDQIEL